MAGVLLIEDNHDKAGQLISYFADKWPQITIVRKESFNTGLAAIRSSEYELVLMDMSLPTFDISLPKEAGGKFRHFGGREILDRISAEQLSTKVCVVTQFDRLGERQEVSLKELDQELSQKFPANYIGLIYYNAAVADWRGALTKVIEGHLL